MKASLAVIIPTVNATAELDLCLRSLAQNSDHPLEICVLIDPDQKTGKVNQQVINVIKKHGLAVNLNSKNLGPYGGWNRGALLTKSPYIVFATDDQYFAPHWDRELVAVHRPKRLVAGRLVEPGILPVYPGNLEKSFGITPAEFAEQEFIAWCEGRGEQGFVKDGFFIPLLISRKDFQVLGGYPTTGQFGTSTAVSNDIEFIKRAQSLGYTFGTACASYSYHFQASSWKKKTLKPKLAAVILTKNEEKALPACLASLSFVDQIVVVDSGSTDQTVAVAKKAGAKVITHPFVDFAAQRNFALRQVDRYDWVLMVDADETVPPALAEELLSFAKDIYLDGVELPRKNYIWGKWIEHTDWYPDYRLVYFRPKSVEYRSGVHERAVFVKGTGNVAQAHTALVHDNYRTVAEFVGKNLVEYPAVYAKQLAAEGKVFTLVGLVTESVGEFFRRFFLTEGWRDGMHGFALSLLMGFQTALAYLYLWELQGKQEALTKHDINAFFGALRNKTGELAYWLATLAIESSTGAGRFLARSKRKLIKLTHK